MSENTPTIKCPKCGSDQITAHKKGFSGKQAVGGAILTGGVGLLAGTIGSNKIKITCLNCGNVFKPGEKPQPKMNLTKAQQTKANNFATIVTGIIFVFVFFFLWKACS